MDIRLARSVSVLILAMSLAAPFALSAVAETIFIRHQTARTWFTSVAAAGHIAAKDSVLRFHLTTRQCLPPFRPGGQLAGIDISADDRWLAVADLAFTVLSDRPDGEGDSN